MVANISTRCYHLHQHHTKITDRVTSAASSMFGDDRRKMQSLMNMGFDSEQARNALEATDGNVEQAADLLLLSSSITTNNNNNNSDTHALPSSSRSSSSSSSRGGGPREVIDLTQSPAATNAATPNNNNSNNNNNPQEEDMLQIAMRESLESEKERKQRQTKSLSSSSSSLSSKKYHSMLTPLQHKTKEEQITRLAARLASHPRAVDTLLIALKAIKDDPSHVKYRTIDQGTAGYITTLKPVSAAEDLLLAVQFVKRTKKQPQPQTLLVMEQRQLDMALLWIAISALEKVRLMKEYKVVKKRLGFQKQVQKLLSVHESHVSEEEIHKRLEYSKRLHTEPPSSSSSHSHTTTTTYNSTAIMKIQLLPDKVVQRRFDVDDQLRDVLYWIGTLSSEIPTKILDGTWCLVDGNLSHPTPIPCDKRSLNLTLQRIGCWPSGRLELRENEEEGEKMDLLNELHSATRGLGVKVSSNNNSSSSSSSNTRG